MAWKILATVSGGMTGFRQALLRGADDSVQEFTTYEAAKVEADRLARRMNHERSMASFSYTPVRS